MKFDYVAFCVGGEGEDAWEREVMVCGADISDAALAALAIMEEPGGHVVRIDQIDSLQPTREEILAHNQDLRWALVNVLDALGALSNPHELDGHGITSQDRDRIIVLAGGTPPLSALGDNAQSITSTSYDGRSAFVTLPRAAFRELLQCARDAHALLDSHYHYAALSPDLYHVKRGPFIEGLVAKHFPGTHGPLKEND